MGVQLDTSFHKGRAKGEVAAPPLPRSTPLEPGESSNEFKTSYQPVVSLNSANNIRSVYSKIVFKVMLSAESTVAITIPVVLFVHFNSYYQIT